MPCSRSAASIFNDAFDSVVGVKLVDESVVDFDLERISQLVDEGDTSLLMTAVRHSQVEVVEYLIDECCVHPDSSDSEITPLELACTHYNAEIFIFLLRRGARYKFFMLESWMRWGDPFVVLATLDYLEVNGDSCCRLKAFETLCEWILTDGFDEHHTTLEAIATTLTVISIDVVLRLDIRALVVLNKSGVAFSENNINRFVFAIALYYGWDSMSPSYRAEKINELMLESGMDIAIEYG